MTRRDSTPDAVVIGAGPNGLVAANLLADAGWSVVVCEAEPEPGGAVRSGEIAPGFTMDRYSAFYPLGVASPVMRALDLTSYGLTWTHAPAVLAHPTGDGRAAVLHHDLEQTAASLDQYAAGDGDAWKELVAEWQEIGPALLEAVFRPFPPVRPGLTLARRLGAARALRLARRVVLPVRRLAREQFRGDGAALLLAGNALHTDLSPDDAGSGIYAWLLAMLGQTVGWPVPVGGSGRLTDALVARARLRGVELRCDAPVESVLVSARRATGVRLRGGERIGARRAVLADVAAPVLYRSLVGDGHLPARLFDDLDRFQWDHGTVKVDWALSGPIPWRVDGPGAAGTVHLGPSMDRLSRFSTELVSGQVPADPFVLLGQMTTADASRSPAGTESAWAYAHVPHRVAGDAGPDGITGSWDERETAAFVARMEAQVEAFAPGFSDLVTTRLVQAPPTLQGHDPTLVGGAINGGTTAPHQQLVFRPVPGLGRPETPIERLYLASMSAHPGGGVHGACGANAAKAALLRRHLPGRVAAGGVQRVDRRLRGY